VWVIVLEGSLRGLFFCGHYGAGDAGLRAALRGRVCGVCEGAAGECGAEGDAAARDVGCCGELSAAHGACEGDDGGDGGEGGVDEDLVGFYCNHAVFDGACSQACDEFLFGCGGEAFDLSCGGPAEGDDFDDFVGLDLSVGHCFLYGGEGCIYGGVNELILRGHVVVYSNW